MKTIINCISLAVFLITVDGQQMDWCTYFQALGLDYIHPECKNVVPEDIQCAGRVNEEFGCSNCQPNCADQYILCTMQCNPGCSCKSGFVRNEQNHCVLPILCPVNDGWIAKVGRCPSASNIGLTCDVNRKNECNTNKDCVANQGFPQSTCCMTDCGNNICFTASSYNTNQ